jgi:putative FmdB family regulatory protein
MPIYEYDCPSCAKVIEAMQKFSDAPLSQCPECQGPVTKKMSLGSFSLKGTGWYVTDYKNRGESKSDSSSKSPKTDS